MVTALVKDYEDAVNGQNEVTALLMATQHRKVSTGYALQICH